jgi:hypothetical protein
MHRTVRELLAKYLNKRIEAGNFAYFAELIRNLPLAKRHEGQRDAYEEIANDLTALLEKFTPEDTG